MKTRILLVQDLRQAVEAVRPCEAEKHRDEEVEGGVLGQNAGMERLKGF